MAPHDPLDTLDTLLVAAAPPVAPRDPGLRRELDAVVADAELTVAPPRHTWRSRLALTGAAVVVLSGLGIGASAAGVLPAPSWAPWYESPVATWTQPVPGGGSCEVRYGVKPVQVDGRRVDAAERDAAVRAATAYVHGFDPASIDVRAAVAAVPKTAWSGDESAADRETFAVQWVLQQRVDEHLADLGLPAVASVSAAQWCEDGAR